MTDALRPLLSLDRYTEEELAYAEQGLCGYVVASYPDIERCGEPSIPDSPYRFCAVHDDEVREDYPGSWELDNADTIAASGGDPS